VYNVCIVYVVRILYTCSVYLFYLFENLEEEEEEEEEDIYLAQTVMTMNMTI